MLFISTTKVAEEVAERLVRRTRMEEARLEYFTVLALLTHLQFSAGCGFLFLSGVGCGYG